MHERLKAVYKPAVGPKLQPWLWVVQAGFTALAANGVYLASVSVMTWWKGTTQQTPFYMLMVFLHLLLGFLIIAPFLGFGLVHLATSWRRPNVKAVQLGLLLFAAALVILISGLVLLRFDTFAIRDPWVRSIAYWLHLFAPLAAIGLYVRHRLAGPRIRWEWARRGGVVVAGFILAMTLLHSHDPNLVGIKGPRQGKRYFFPSEAVTADGQFIPAETLMMDRYCLKCHEDAYQGWFHSAHHFSSFNNKAYLASVRETREVAIKRDGNTQAARWCAGCHDPVPFFSGEFDNPAYDDVNTPSSQAGITCVVCHSITHVNSTRGNADYTIAAPQHYPFASQRQPDPPVDQRDTDQSQAGDAQENVLETGDQGREVLLNLPQGEPPLCPQPLQRLPPRPEPLRHLPALGRFRARSPQLLLPPRSQEPMRRLPHVSAALERLRSARLRRPTGA